MNQTHRNAGRFLLTTSWFVITMLTAGCGRVGGPVSLEQAVASYIGKRAPGMQNVQVSGPVDTPDGKLLALYTFTVPPSGEDEANYCQGYLEVRREDAGGWEIAMSGTTGCSNVPPLALDALGRVAETYVMVSGAVVNERATAIEATLDTGERVQAKVDDGFFAIFAGREAGVCRLRLLDAEGEVIYSTVYELNLSRERGCPEEE